MPEPTGVPAPSGPSGLPGGTSVAIIGGGITGLATAWYVRAGAPLGGGDLDVTIVESSGRLGGKIRTETLEGLPVEAGPDTFLARVPGAVDLARQIGIGDDLVAPATAEAFVCHRGRLRPLPRGTVLGVPITARSLLGAGLLSPAGRARAALDLVLPRRRPLGNDPSVAEVVRARLGTQVLERLVDPLVGGINAGQAETLSLRSTARPLAVAAEQNRSLIFGLRAGRSPTTADETPVFLSVTGGMERLVERLASSLDAVHVRTSTSVVSLTPDGGRWRLHADPGPDLVADAVVLTVPAFVAGPLLSTVSPEAANQLNSIRHASVVTATLAYRPEAVSALPQGSGFLVPRSEGRLLTACTFSTSKWPDLADHGLVLLRVSAGRDGDDRTRGLDDDALVARLHWELGDLVGAAEQPVAWRVDRWDNGFPQYEPGHEARVERVEAALALRGGLFVAGAAYKGVGIAACVQQAETAAARVKAHLSRHPAAAGET